MLRVSVDRSGRSASRFLGASKLRRCSFAVLSHVVAPVMVHWKFLFEISSQPVGRPLLSGCIKVSDAAAACVVLWCFVTQQGSLVEKPKCTSRGKTMQRLEKN